MQMPEPSAGHRTLERMVGNWQGEETMHPSQWDPAGGVAVGKTLSRLSLNGFALISEYEQVRDGVTTFSGHGVMTFDPKEDLYTLHWFDCMGSPPEEFRGRLEGDTLVVAHAGPGMHARLTYELADPQRMRTRMEISSDGRDWKPMFDAVYEKH